MKCFACAALVLMSTAFPLFARTQPKTATLASLRDRQRVLLVFANGDNGQAVAQLRVADEHAAGFRERDLVLAGIEGTRSALPTVLLSPEEDTAARKRFDIHPGQFTVLLIGKDGGEKLRQHTAMSWSLLQRTIDAMPMRQDEVRSK